MLEVLLGTTGQLGELILRTGHDQILLRVGLHGEARRAVRMRGISTRAGRSADERYGSDRPGAAEVAAGRRLRQPFRRAWEAATLNTRDLSAGDVRKQRSPSAASLVVLGMDQ